MIASARSIPGRGGALTALPRAIILHALGSRRERVAGMGRPGTVDTLRPGRRFSIELKYRRFSIELKYWSG